MTLLHCKAGPAQVPMMGTMYTFAPDKHGRAVAEVTIAKHKKLFLAAGVYEELPPEAPTKAELADPLTHIRAALLSAGSPAIIRRVVDEKPAFFLTAAWPETIAVKDELTNDLPAFVTMDKDASLTFTVENGIAVYAFKGKVDETALYEIDVDSAEFTPEGGPAQNPAGSNSGSAPSKTHELIEVKGIGPGLLKKLNAEGITTLDQLVGLDAVVLTALTKKLKLKDEVVADWIDQAKKLLAPAPAQ